MKPIFFKILGVGTEWTTLKEEYNPLICHNFIFKLGHCEVFFSQLSDQKQIGAHPGPQIPLPLLPEFSVSLGHHSTPPNQREDFWEDFQLQQKKLGALKIAFYAFTVQFQ